MSKVVILLFIAMLVLHQDFWAWDDASLVLGFMPMGLFYHAVFALASAALGVLAIRFMWPHSEDESEPETSAGKGGNAEIGEADLDLLD